MLKKLSTILIFFALFTLVAQAQNWTFEGAWPDTNYKGGTHGIEVTPDGKVWTSSYYPTVWADGGGVNARPIIVFNADGTLDDTIWTVTTGGVTDTLGVGAGNTRGMGMGPDGNIYYSQAGPAKMIKINYQTKAGMARALTPETGSSPAGPSISDDGTVFLGPVVGGGTSAIVMYDSDLNFLGNAVSAPPNIVRTIAVSKDGLTLYWPMFTGTQGIDIYTRADIFSDFEFADSVLRGMSIETAKINPATGLLWVSNDSRGTNMEYTHLTWYGYDVTAKAIVDSFSLPYDDSQPPSATDQFPRGLAFNSTGNIAYVGLFGTSYDRLYRFSSPVGVKPDPNTVAADYTLSQNYPNPFNPSTDIKFSVKDAGLVTLKVYDILGKEVAVLVNETLNNGAYSVKFDASNLSSGTYVYRLTVNGNQLTKKMLLMK
jgi:hypothetical protein